MREGKAKQRERLAFRMTPDEGPIHIFLDETGTLSNAEVAGDYGIGWVIIEEGQLNRAKLLLKKNRIESIHLREVKKSEKIRIARKIASARLQSTGLLGGSLIRKDWSFAANIAENAINKAALENPEALIREGRRAHRANPQKILTPRQLVPQRAAAFMRKVRLQEAILLATRYPLMTAVRMRGLRDIHLHVSAVSNSAFHGEAVASIKHIITNGLNPLLGELRRRGLFRPPGKITPKEIEIQVTDQSDKLFGIADYFAFLGYMLASDVAERREMGHAAYEETRLLAPQALFNKRPEVLPGIFVRSNDDTE